MKTVHPSQAAGPGVLPKGATAELIAYFGLLTLSSGLGAGLAAIPIAFFLKEELGLGPQQMARYQVITAVPACLGFLFGLLRDRRSPFGWGDRGYFLLVPPLVAASYGWLALGPLSYARLLAAVLAANTFSLLLGAAVRGLMTAVAQRLAMTGRLTALFLVLTGLPGAFSAIGGGWLESRVPPAAVFLSVGALSLGMVPLAFWRPRSVFPGQGTGAATPTASRAAASESTREALLRLLRCRRLYPALTILFLWMAAPGWGTPLFYYLTDAVKLSSGAFGTMMGIMSGGAICATAGYGLLCRRVPLRRLLWATTTLSILTNLSFLLIHNAAQAYLIGAFVGVLTAAAFASFNDLYTRCCPRELEGTAMLAAGGLMAVAYIAADLLGAWLYEQGGFGLALGVSTATNVLILAALPLVPRGLMATADGQQLPEEVRGNLPGAVPDIA